MTSGYPINGSPPIHYMIIFQKQSLDIFAGAVAQLVVVPVMQVDLEVVAARARDALMKQRQHDAFLVSTYTSVKDIEALRDARHDQLKAQRAAAEQYVESLRVRLGTLQSRALNYSPYNKDARRMPDDLAENLVRTSNELHVQSSALAVKGSEETALLQQFQADIERYRELHSIHSQSSEPSAPRAAATQPAPALSPATAQ